MLTQISRTENVLSLSLKCLKKYEMVEHFRARVFSIHVDQGFYHIWWLLKEPFVCEPKLIILSFGFLLGLLGQKHSLDVGKNTSLCDGDTGKQFVQLLVITDSQLKVTGDDSCLLVVTSSVARQLEDLSAQILEHGSQVHWSTGANTLSIVTFAEKTMDTTNWELEPCSG